MFNGIHMDPAHGRGGYHSGHGGLEERLAAAQGGPFGGGFGGDGEWGMDGGGHRGGHRGGGRRRIFDSGELRLVLLKLIADKARHGYDLIRAIEEITKGAYAPSPGVVYPTLTLLSEMGFIQEQVTEGARKLFEITSEGGAHLAENAPHTEHLLAKLSAIGEARGRSDIAPIRRAIHNLRHVLENRLGGGPGGGGLGVGLDDDRLHEAVALIDDVARKIERL